MEVHGQIFSNTPLPRFKATGYSEVTGGFRLERRAKLVNKAIYLAVGSAISTTLLLMMAFTAAFFGLRHELGAGALFLVALALMCGALVSLAREVRIALSEFDQHA